ncbi:MAG: DUF167 domain-containing protein [Acidimicrobiia bacterium]
MPTSPVQKGETGPIVSVWVVPGASRAAIDGLHGDRLKLRVTSPPEGGRANDEAAHVLQSAIGQRVTLVSGMRSRAKLFQVTGGDDVDTVRRKLRLQ